MTPKKKIRRIIMARPRGETIPYKCAGCSQVHLSGNILHFKKTCLKRNKYCIEAVKECKGKDNDYNKDGKK
jgi:hypothetical protein